MVLSSSSSCWCTLLLCISMELCSRGSFGRCISQWAVLWMRERRKWRLRLSIKRKFRKKLRRLMVSTSRLIRTRLLSLILLSKERSLRWRWTWTSWRKLKILRISRRKSLPVKGRLPVTGHFEVSIGANWCQRWWRTWVFLQSSSKDQGKDKRRGRKACCLQNWRERRWWISMIWRTNKKKISIHRCKTFSTN